MIKSLFISLSLFALANSVVYGQPFGTYSEEQQLFNQFNALGKTINKTKEKLALENERINQKKPERIGTESIVDHANRIPQSLVRSNIMLYETQDELSEELDRLQVIAYTLMLALKLNETNADNGLAFVSMEVCNAMNVGRSRGFANENAIDKFANIAVKMAEEYANEARIPTSTLSIVKEAIIEKRNARMFLFKVCKRMRDSKNWK